MDQCYQSRVISVEELTSQQIETMEQLYLSNYDGSCAALFHSDLADKDEAILIYNQQRLVGFTSLKLIPFSRDGRPARAVYSGDTIVDPGHWGQHELAFAWLARLGEIKRENPCQQLFWFLLVKGHRTYKYLAVFANAFYPHWSEQRDDLKRLADQLAGARFGADYDPRAGVVRFPESRGHLRADLAEIPAREQARPATQFFLTRNPGYRQGHELVCICELEAANLKPLAARVFQGRRQSLD